MTAEELRQVIAMGESETLELKSGIPSPDAIAQQIAAFANTQGGFLILGVREPAISVGVDKRKARSAIDRAREKLSPQLNLEIESIEIDGKNLIVVKIPRSSTLVSSAGGFFRRDGQHFRPFRADEIGKLLGGHSVSEVLKTLSEAVATQTETIGKQSETIENLHRDFKKANSPLRRFGIPTLTAIGGALLKHVIDSIL